MRLRYWPMPMPSRDRLPQSCSRGPRSDRCTGPLHPGRERRPHALAHAWCLGKKKICRGQHACLQVDEAWPLRNTRTAISRICATACWPMRRATRAHLCHARGVAE